MVGKRIDDSKPEVNASKVSRDFIFLCNDFLCFTIQNTLHKAVKLKVLLAVKSSFYNFCSFVSHAGRDGR